MMNEEKARNLLREWIEDENLRLHCEMVAHATKWYAIKLGKDEETQHEWWLTGMLHDIDWEKKPDEHPNYALEHIFPDYDLNPEITHAIAAHAPARSGIEPETELDRYLFSCDELSGFMNAVALMRPNGFSDMKVKSVTKKLKDKKFAANVSREDIKRGAELIELERNEHIANMIEAFKAI